MFFHITFLNLWTNHYYFLFLDLQPGTEYGIGISAILGTNQSNPATMNARTGNQLSVYSNRLKAFNLHLSNYPISYYLVPLIFFWYVLHFSSPAINL